MIGCMLRTSVNLMSIEWYIVRSAVNLDFVTAGVKASDTTKERSFSLTASLLDSPSMVDPAERFAKRESEKLHFLEL